MDSGAPDSPTVHVYTPRGPNMVTQLLHEGTRVPGSPVGRPLLRRRSPGFRAIFSNVILHFWDPPDSVFRCFGDHLAIFSMIGGLRQLAAHSRAKRFFFFGLNITFSRFNILPLVVAYSKT